MVTGGVRRLWEMWKGNPVKAALVIVLLAAAVVASVVYDVDVNLVLDWLR